MSHEEIEKLKTERDDYQGKFYRTRDAWHDAKQEVKTCEKALDLLMERFSRTIVTYEAKLQDAEHQIELLRAGRDKWLNDLEKAQDELNKMSEQFVIAKAGEAGADRVLDSTRERLTKILALPAVVGAEQGHFSPLDLLLDLIEKKVKA